LAIFVFQQVGTTKQLMADWKVLRRQSFWKRVNIEGRYYVCVCLTLINVLYTGLLSFMQWWM